MEHYCSLQVSQLLVRLGFKQKTKVVYVPLNVWKHGKVCKTWGCCECGISVRAKRGEFPCPTHAEAIEWLRKYKKVLISVQICRFINGIATYQALVEYFDDGYDPVLLENDQTENGYKTPYQATEAALKFVISNLLKN